MKKKKKKMMLKVMLLHPLQHSALAFLVPPPALWLIVDSEASAEGDELEI